MVTGDIGRLLEFKHDHVASHLFQHLSTIIH